MKIKPYVNILVLPFISFASHAMDGRTVMDKVIQVSYYQGQDVRADAYMRIVDRQGRERTRELTVLRRNINANKEQKYYVYFKKPSDVKKMAFMAWKNVEKDDTAGYIYPRWI